MVKQYKASSLHENVDSGPFLGLMDARHSVVLASDYAALEARCATLLADVNQDEGYERLKAALQSIASNTCCDKCQEAALVARRALGLTLETKGEGQ